MNDLATADNFICQNLLAAILFQGVGLSQVKDVYFENGLNMDKVHKMLPWIR